MDLEEQENELFALESILDANSCELDKKSGEIKIEPILKLSKLSVCIPSFQTDNDASTNSDINYEVEFLPPFTLNFTYPSAYPSSSPPDYTLSCIWLSRRQVRLVRYLA